MYTILSFQVNQTVFTDDDLGPENRLMKMWFKKNASVIQVGVDSINKM